MLKILNYYKKLVKEDESKYGVVLISILSVIFFISCFSQHITPDSAGYLRETLLISQCIKEGHWFGNYPVGIHGFLFKIPLALIFTFTGPSVIAGSFYTTVLSIIVLVLFYKILINRLHFGVWACLAIFLLTFNYRFLISSITYLREIPMLLSVLLFIDAVLTKKSKWLIGLFLLMVFDAKEYMFITLVPVYLIWSFIYEYVKERRLLCFIKKLGDRLVAGFLPSAVLLYTMFFTSISPANMFAASIIGLADSKYSEINNLDVVVQATVYNKINKQEVPRTVPETKTVIDIGTYPVLNYLLKIISSKSFSFESIPLSIFFPALVMSVVQYIRWKRTNEKNMLILPLTLLIFLCFYLLRLGRARYLFPVIPITTIMFIYFLREQNTKLIKWVLVLTFLIIFLSAFAEGENLITDVGLNVFVLFLVVIYFLLRNKHFEFKIKNILWFAVPISLAVGMSLIVSVVPYIKDIRNQYMFGINFETDKIANLEDSWTVIWMNNYLSKDVQTELLQFYREDTSIDPEWYAQLKEWVPKKHLQVRIKPNTYLYKCDDMGFFKKKIETDSVQKIIIIKSLSEKLMFPGEECYEKLKDQAWLSYDREVILKNKKAYIFKVL